jgi:hypothetical protein
MKAYFLLAANRDGAGFAGGASCHYKSIKLFEKNFLKFWKIRNLSDTHAATAPRLLRCDKPGTLQKLLHQTSRLASDQYGLQIAEGMVTFFESYERELVRAMGVPVPQANNRRRASRFDQARASAMGEGSIAIELVHQYLDRF